MAQASLFDELGGEPVLRKIIDRFVDRLFDDVMIGFHFQASSVSRERIKEKEYEFAARHLGASLEYTGRPIDAAHRRHDDGQCGRHGFDHGVRHPLGVRRQHEDVRRLEEPALLVVAHPAMQVHAIVQVGSGDAAAQCLEVRAATGEMKLEGRHVDVAPELLRGVEQVEDPLRHVDPGEKEDAKRSCGARRE